MGTRALLLLAIGVVGASAACKAAPDYFPEGGGVPPAPVRVVFRPPEGSPIVEKSVTTRSEGAAGASSTEAVHATLSSTFEKAGGGFLLTQRTTDVRLERGGVVVQSPLSPLVAKLVLKIQLAADGAFVALANPEDVDAAVRAAFPDPKQAEAVGRFFSAETMAAQARQEWDAKFGQLLGRDVLPGYAWYAEESLASAGGGQRRYVVQRRVAHVRSGERGRELVVELACPANPDAAANSVALRQFLERAEGLALDGAVACSGEQVIALEPFAPVSLRFDASMGEVSIQRTVRTEVQ